MENQLTICLSAESHCDSLALTSVQGSQSKFNLFIIPGMQAQISSWREGQWLFRNEDKSFTNGTLQLTSPLLGKDVYKVSVSRAGRVKFSQIELAGSKTDSEGLLLLT